MKPINAISVVLAVALIGFGIYLAIQKQPAFFMPGVIGISLLYVGCKRGRTSLIVFGHTCVIVGCILIT